MSRVNRDDDWEAALAAELPHVPEGGPRTWWVVGGWWLAVLRRPANWPARLMSLMGFGLFTMWTYVAVAAVTDDAPDMPLPEGGWFATANATVAMLFLFACWRPLLAAVIAVPATVALDFTVAAAASAQGYPVIAVILFTGLVALFFGLTLAMALAFARPAPEGDPLHAGELA